MMLCDRQMMVTRNIINLKYSTSERKYSGVTEGIGMRNNILLGLVNRVGRKYQSNLASSDGVNVTFSSITKQQKENQDVSNVIRPGNTESSPRCNEQPVKYILNCLFSKNNAHFTYSAVVEDVNFLRNNSGLSYNESFLYYLNLPRKVKFSISTGCLGFRKAARGEYEAAFQTSAKVFQLIQDRKLMDKDIEIVMKDFGKGRAAFIAALNGKEGAQIRKNVIRISDKTALKFGGVRAPRIRRL